METGQSVYKTSKKCYKYANNLAATTCATPSQASSDNQYTYIQNI